MTQAAPPNPLPGVPGERHGRATRLIENAHCWVEVLAGGGPRIVGFGLAGEQNLLAETPDVRWDSGHGVFELVGGHRLWFAPETPDCSVPDSAGLEVAAIPGGVSLTGMVESPTGLRKTLDIVLEPGVAAASIRHVLRNAGDRILNISPWPITQLRLGGVAVVELPLASVEHGMTPNQLVVLWPYASWVDERFHLGERAMTVRATPGDPFKVGCLSATGLVGYRLEDMMFVLGIDAAADRPRADMGCNVEIYSDRGTIELETLGPLVRLAPGDTAVHVERWSVARVGDLRGDAAHLAELLGPAPR